MICADRSGHFYNDKVYSTFSWYYLLHGLNDMLPAGIIPFVDAIWIINFTWIRTYMYLFILVLTVYRIEKDLTLDLDGLVNEALSFFEFVGIAWIGLRGF